MDEKTEQLRDIFMDVSEAETVTESQVDDRRSFSDADDEKTEKRLRSLVADLREREGFETDLSLAAYVRIVRGFYEDESDADLAAALDTDAETVRRARLDCHLVRERDRQLDAEVPEAVIEDVVSEDQTVDTAAAAADLDVSEGAFERFCGARRAEAASRGANHRFRSAFEELLTDADLRDSFTEGVRESGLEEAAEDIETDVSF